MVGVGAALHLQKRGRDVILADRHNLAGEETSYGNSGIIECASVFPYMFPRDFGQILKYALNRAPSVRYRIADLPEFLPWLVRYFLASSPGQVFTRDQLMNHVWDFVYAGDASTVTVHIRRLREKIEADPERPLFLKTVWGVGYKFETEHGAT